MTSALDHMTTVERMENKLHRAHEQRAARAYFRARIDETS